MVPYLMQDKLSPLAHTHPLSLPIHIIIYYQSTKQLLICTWNHASPHGTSLSSFLSGTSLKTGPHLSHLSYLKPKAQPLIPPSPVLSIFQPPTPPPNNSSNYCNFIIVLTLWYSFYPHINIQWEFGWLPFVTCCTIVFL